MNLESTHLDRVYQVYSKQLPYKGICIRIEEQLHFPSPSNSASPTLSSLPGVVILPSPEDILDTVIPSPPSPLSDSLSFFPSSPDTAYYNPLHILKDLEE